MHYDNYIKCETFLTWERYGAARHDIKKRRVYCHQRPYHVQSTGSRLITAVKQRWAWLVLGWVTAWEHHVLLALFFYLLFKHILSFFFISKILPLPVTVAVE